MYSKTEHQMIAESFRKKAVETEKVECYIVAKKYWLIVATALRESGDTVGAEQVVSQDIFRCDSKETHPYWLMDQYKRDAEKLPTLDLMQKQNQVRESIASLTDNKSRGVAVEHLQILTGILIKRGH